MKNITTLFNWREELKEADSNAVYIDDELVLLDKLIMASTAFGEPFRTDVVSCIIVLKGEMKGRIDLKPYHSKASSMITILPGQILEEEYISPDFQGKFVFMSKRFLDSLGIEDRFSRFVSVRDNPSVPLSAKELEVMQLFYAVMWNTLSSKGHPYRLEIARNMTRAFFYGIGYLFHNMDNKTKTKNELLVDNFIKLVQTHYKQQRKLEFYADKLCLTPKYMSTKIKQAGGKPAGDWIDDYVMLEARALLKSTNMTIQQISDELNFPSQSFFGKYFKRHAGMSPKEYRKG